MSKVAFGLANLVDEHFPDLIWPPLLAALAHIELELAHFGKGRGCSLQSTGSYKARVGQTLLDTAVEALVFELAKLGLSTSDNLTYEDSAAEHIVGGHVQSLSFEAWLEWPFEFPR